MRVAYENLSTSKAVRAAPATLCGAVLAGGSAASTLTIYDNTNAASGTVLLKLAAPIGGHAALQPGAELYARLGLYAAISGTGASATILYKP